MVAFVVPLLAAHLIVMFSVPDGAPGGALAKVPVPFPPVAATGVQLVNVAVILPATVFVASFVHFPGWVTADAGSASGNATIDAAAATVTNARARIETFIELPLC